MFFTFFPLFLILTVLVFFFSYMYFFQNLFSKSFLWFYYNFARALTGVLQPLEKSAQARSVCRRLFTLCCRVRRCYGSETHGPISGLKKRDTDTLYTGRIRRWGVKGNRGMNAGCFGSEEWVEFILRAMIKQCRWWCNNG